MRSPYKKRKRTRVRNLDHRQRNFEPRLELSILDHEEGDLYVICQFRKTVNNTELMERLIKSFNSSPMNPKYEAVSIEIGPDIPDKIFQDGEYNDENNFG